MKNIQIKFKMLYERLDEALKIKLSRTLGGIESYIGFLLAFGASDLGGEVAKRLRRYSEEINPEGSEVSTITKSDLAWLSAFIRKISGKKDPLSKYLNCR